MENIVKRLIENHRLDEMAYDRRDAINRCSDLGKQFIAHFHEVYSLGADDIDFKHHCQEMQSWYDEVKDIVLKSNKRCLSSDQLVNWFFTKGSSVERLFKDEDEASAYDEMMVELISSKRSKRVVDVFSEILKEESNKEE